LSFEEIQRSFAGAVGPAFEPDDLSRSFAAGDSTTTAEVQYAGAIDTATRSAVAKIRRLQKTSSPAEIVSVIALVKADQKPGLLSSVRVMTSMLRKEYGDEVNLVTGGVCVCVGEADPKAKSGSVAVWVRTLGP
jgi:hypothetical protein